MTQVKYKCPECGHNGQVTRESIYWAGSAYKHFLRRFL